MADTDTPDTEAKKPVTRRRAPRKTSAPKPAVAPAKPATSLKSAERPTAEKPATATPKKVAVKPAPKPRSTKRATPRPTRKAVSQPVAVKPADKTGGRWGAAAIAGGIAVIGAAAALLTLRGSTPKPPVSDKKGNGAHQADGTDSSKSFEAGIADEGTIPE